MRPRPLFGRMVLLLEFSIVFLSLLSDHLIQWSDFWVHDMYYSYQSMRRNFRKSLDLQIF